MDFRKIILIFLGIFITLDIFLAYAWLQTQQTVTKPASALDVVNEMQNDNITLPSLTDVRGSGSYVSAQTNNNVLLDKRTQLRSDFNVRVNNGLLRVNLPKPLKLGQTTSEQVATLQKLLKHKSMVINGQEYSFNQVASRYAAKANGESNVLIFSQTAVDNQPFNTTAGQLRFNLNDDNELIGYSQRYLAQKTRLRDADNLISQARAVAVAYQYNQIENNQKVLDVNLVYSELTQVDGDVIYVPSWQLTVQDVNSNINEQYVNAFNGTLLK